MRSFNFVVEHDPDTVLFIGYVPDAATQDCQGHRGDPSELVGESDGSLVVAAEPFDLKGPGRVGRET